MNKERLLAYLKAIWPTVYRIINGGIYFILNLIKTFFRLAMEEIKGGGGY